MTMGPPVLNPLACGIGPTKSKFIVHCLGELEELAQESIAATGCDVVSSLYTFPRIGDDHTLARMEIGLDTY